MKMLALVALLRLCYLILKEQFSSVKSHTNSLFVWHVRLGHLPFTKIKGLGLLTDVSDDVINQCSVCSKRRNTGCLFLIAKFIPDIFLSSFILICGDHIMSKLTIDISTF